MEAKDLLGAIAQRDADPFLVEDIETATVLTDEYNNASYIGVSVPGEDEFDRECQMLGLHHNNVSKIHWYNNGAYCSFVLPEDWKI